MDQVKHEFYFYLLGKHTHTYIELLGWDLRMHTTGAFHWTLMSSVWKDFGDSRTLWSSFIRLIASGRKGTVPEAYK